jgi:general secretion pathway protein G
MREGDNFMKKMLKKKSKGFTLVELLIVVIIIGILAGMMMLSTGGATAKAEATKIVSDMRNLKAAAIMVYADGGEWPTTLASLDNYMDQKISDNSNFALDAINYSIQYKVASLDEPIRTALGKMAASGLPLYITAGSDDVYDGDTSGVFMPFK